MSATQFILTDEMELIAAAVKTALGLSVLNYQYGYVEELVMTLEQMEQSPAGYASKYPLMWIAEPYQVKHGEQGIDGVATVDIFIINNSVKEWKAKDRMTNNFKPVIYPIYNEMLNQIKLSSAFNHPYTEPDHSTVNRYYFGENSRSILNDVVDAMKISGMKLRISHKQNCSPFTNM